MYVGPISTPRVETFFRQTPALRSNAPRVTLFGSVLEKAGVALASLDQDSAQAQLALLSGSARDMHTAALSVEKAGLALDLVIAVRNKAIEAYQEIMRMPV